MTHQYKDMDPFEALYTVVRQYPDGLGKLSELMGMSEGVLRQKVSPKVLTHNVTAKEFFELIQLCEEAGVPNAKLPLLAANCKLDLEAFTVPQLETLSDDDVSGLVCRVMKEHGDVASVVSKSLKDGKITELEMDEIEREFQEALAAVGEWRDRIRKKFNSAENRRAIK